MWGVEVAHDGIGFAFAADFDGDERLPADPTGFTHNAAAGDIDGDGDVDILVANNGGDWIAGPYFLLNDGLANFVADRSMLPDKVETEWERWPWAVQLADLDNDGHLDLIVGATGVLDGKSYVYWGSPEGEYRDEDVTVLATSDFFTAYGRAQVISTAVHDFNGDGRPDVLLGGYDDATLTDRGVQLLTNAGGRAFVDETRRRLGKSAWAVGETAHMEQRFLDFNGDGTVDIVPQHYPPGQRVLAWLNDGTGHYAVLKTTAFNDTEALRFAYGLIVRAGGDIKSLDFFSDGTYLGANAGVVVEGAVVRRQH